MHFTPVTIPTERLTLRWFEPGDAAGLFAIFSDPDVVRYWSSPEWSDISFAEKMIDETIAAYQSGDGVRLAVIETATGKLVGQVNLHHMFHSNRRCEVGYALARAHWGKGYAVEAMQAALDYAFGPLNLNRIEADIDPRNGASEKVLTRMGFKEEGFMPERWIVKGEMCDTTYFGLLKRDWDAR
jgi:[ribosomal protein S5]-alanine N-acetyltransferase